MTSTWWLTTGVDNIVGTSGDDTVIAGPGSAGGNHTLGAADVIDGKAGTDTMNITTDGAAVMSLSVGSLKNVEIINIQGMTTGAAGTTLNLVNATGVQQIWNARSTDATEVTVTNVQELATVGVRGAITGSGVYNVAFKDSLASGTDDSITVALDGATIADLGVGGVTVANEFENITFNATGTNTVTALTDTATAATALSQTKTVSVTGDGKLTLGAAALSNTVTSLDASKNTGGVTATLGVAGAGAQTVIGGTGNDTFFMANTLTTADKIDGGEGSNTIGVTTGASLATGLQVTNFQTLDIGGADNQTAGNAYDVSKLTGITTLKVGSAINATVAGTQTTTVNNLAKGAGVEINSTLGNVVGDVLAVNVKDSGAGSPNDVIDVVVKGATAINTTGVLQIDNIETVNLTADKSTAAGAVTHTIASLKVDQAKTVAVKDGSAALTITSLDANEMVLFDATAATKAVSVTVLGTASYTATDGVAFKMGSGNDTVVLTGASTGSAAATAEFYVTGGKGGDAITLTAAGQAEHLIYTGAGESNAGVVGTTNQFDVITNFTTTEDKIDLKAFGFDGVLTSALKVGAAADINATTGELAAGKAANFFGAGGDQRAVVIVDDTTDTWVYVDANKDGSFNEGDLAIELASVTGAAVPVLADFLFA